MKQCVKCKSSMPIDRNHIWCTPCHSQYDKERYHNDRINNPAKILWRNAKLRARKRSIEFNITVQDIIIPNKCPIYNKAFEYGEKGAPGDWAPTLDRINPNKGYIRDNIAVISYRANTIKNKGTVEDLRKILTWLEEQNG